MRLIATQKTTISLGRQFSPVFSTPVRANAPRSQVGAGPARHCSAHEGAAGTMPPGGPFDRSNR